MQVIYSYYLIIRAQTDFGICESHHGTCPACVLGLDLIEHMLSDEVACSVGCSIGSSRVLVV